MKKSTPLQVFPSYSSPFSGMQSRILRVGRGLNCTFTSIVVAIAASKPYDRIEIEAGEYFETVAIGHPLELVGSKEDEKPSIVAQGLCVTINADGPVLVDNIRILTHTTVNSTCASILVVHGTPCIRNCDMSSMQVTNYCEPKVTGCQIVNSDGGIGLRVMDKASGEYTHNLIAYHKEECIRVQTTGSPIFRNNRILQKERRSVRSVITFSGAGCTSEGQTLFMDNIVSGTGVVAAEEGVEEALRMKAETLTNDADITSSESLIFVTNQAQPIFRGNFLCNGKHGFFFTSTSMPEENFKENRIAACNGWGIVVGNGTVINVERNDIQKCGGGILIHHNKRPKNSGHFKKKANHAEVEGGGVEDTGDSGSDSEEERSAALLMSPEEFREVVRHGIMDREKQPDDKTLHGTMRKRVTHAPVCISGCTFRHNYQFAIHVKKSNVEIMENVFSENRIGLHMSTECGKSAVYKNEFNYHVHAALELMNYAKVKLLDNSINGGSVANTRVLLEGVSHDLYDRRQSKEPSKEQNTSTYGIYMENHSSVHLVNNYIGGSVINVAMLNYSSVKAEKNVLKKCQRHHIKAELFSSVHLVDNEIQEAQGPAVLISNTSSGVIHKNFFRANEKEAIMLRQSAKCRVTQNYFSSCHFGIRVTSASQCAIHQNQFMLSYSVILVQDEYSDVLVTGNKFFTTAASFVEASGRCTVVSRSNRFEGSLGPAFVLSDGPLVQVEKCGFLECPGGFFRVYGFTEMVKIFIQQCKLDFTKEHGLILLGSVMGSISKVLISRCQATAIFLHCDTPFEVFDNRLDACGVCISVLGAGEIYDNVIEGWSEQRNEYTIIGIHAAGTSTAVVRKNYLHDCHVGVLVEQNAAVRFHEVTVHQALDVGIMVWGEATQTVFHKVTVTESDMAGVLLRGGATCQFLECNIADSLHASVISCSAGAALFMNCKLQCDSCELYVDAAFRLPIEYGPLSFHFNNCLCLNGGYRPQLKKIKASCADRMLFVKPKTILESNRTPDATTSRPNTSSLASPEQRSTLYGDGPQIKHCSLGNIGTRQVIVAVRGWIYVENCIIEAQDAPREEKKRRVVAADDGRAPTILPSSTSMQPGSGIVVLNDGGVEAHHVQIRECPYAGVVAQRLALVRVTESTIENCGVGALFVSSENAPVEVTGTSEQRRPVTETGAGSGTAEFDGSTRAGPEAKGRLTGAPASVTGTLEPHSPKSGREHALYGASTSAISRCDYRLTEPGRGGSKDSRSPCSPAGRLSCCLESVAIRSISFYGVQWSAGSTAELHMCSVENSKIGLRVGDAAQVRLQHVKVSRCWGDGMEIFGKPLNDPMSRVQHLEICNCGGYGVSYRRLGVIVKKEQPAMTQSIHLNGAMSWTTNPTFNATMNSVAARRFSTTIRKEEGDLQGSLTAFTCASGTYNVGLIAEMIMPVYPSVLAAGPALPHLINRISFMESLSGGLALPLHCPSVSPALMGTLPPPNDHRLSSASTSTTVTQHWNSSPLEVEGILREEEELPAPIAPLEDAMANVFHFAHSRIHDNGLGEVFSDSALCFLECTFEGQAPVGLLFCGKEAQLLAFKSVFTNRAEVHIVMESCSRLRLLDCGVEKSVTGILAAEPSLIALQCCSFRELEVGLVCGTSYFLNAMMGLQTVPLGDNRSSVGIAASPRTSTGPNSPPPRHVVRCELVQNAFNNCAEGVVYSDQFFSYLKEDMKKSSAATGLRLKHRSEAQLVSFLRLRIFSNHFRDSKKSGCKIDAAGCCVHLVKCEYSYCLTGVLSTSHASDSAVVVRDCTYEMGAVGVKVRHGTDTVVTNCTFRQQSEAAVALHGGSEVDLLYNDFLDQRAPGGAVLIDVSVQNQLHQMASKSSTAKMERMVYHWRDTMATGSWRIRGNIFKNCASAIRMPSEKVPCFLSPKVQIFRNLIRNCETGFLASSTAVESSMGEEKRLCASAEAKQILFEDSKAIVAEIIQNRFEENGTGVEVEGDTSVVIWHSQFISNRKNAIRISQNNSNLVIVDNYIASHGRLAKTVNEAVFDGNANMGGIDGTAALHLTNCGGHVCSNEFRENKVAIYMESVGKSVDLVVGGNRFRHNERTLRIADRSSTLILHNTFLQSILQDVHITSGAAQHKVILAYNRFLSSQIPCCVLFDRFANAHLYRNLFTANANVAVHVLSNATASIAECLFYAVGIGIQAETESTLHLAADYFVQHAESAVRVMPKSTVVALRCAFVTYPNHRTMVLNPETKCQLDACVFLGAQRVIGSLEPMLVTAGSLTLNRCRFDGKQPAVVIDVMSKADIRFNEFYGNDTGIEVRRNANVMIEDNTFWLTRFGAVSLQANCEGIVKNNDMPENSVISGGEHEVQVVMPRTGLSDNPFLSAGLDTIPDAEEKIMKLYALLLEDAPAAMPWKKSATPSGEEEKPEKLFFQLEHVADTSPTESVVPTKKTLQKSSVEAASDEMVEGGDEEQGESVPMSSEEEEQPSGSSNATKRQYDMSTSMPSLVPMPLGTDDLMEKAAVAKGLLGHVNDAGEGLEDPFRVILRQKDKPVFVGNDAVLSIEPRENIDGKEKKKKKKGADVLCARKPPKEKLSAFAEALLEEAERIHKTDCQPVISKVRSDFIRFQLDRRQYLSVLPWTQACQLSNGLEIIELEEEHPQDSKEKTTQTTPRGTLQKSKKKNDSQSVSLHPDKALMANAKGVQKDVQLTARQTSYSPHRKATSAVNAAVALAGPSALPCQIDVLVKHLKKKAEEGSDESGSIIPTAESLGISPYGLAPEEGDNVPLGAVNAAELLEMRVAQYAAAPSQGRAPSLSAGQSQRKKSQSSESKESAKTLKKANFQLGEPERDDTAATGGSQASEEGDNASERFPQQGSGVHIDQRGKIKNPKKKKKKNTLYPIRSVDLKTKQCHCTYDATPGKTIETYRLENAENKGIPHYNTENLGFPSYKKERLDLGDGIAFDLFSSDYTYCGIPLNVDFDDSLEGIARRSCRSSLSEGFDNLDPLGVERRQSSSKRQSPSLKNSFSWAISSTSQKTPQSHHGIFAEGAIHGDFLDDGNPFDSKNSTRAGESRPSSGPGDAEGTTREPSTDVLDNNSRRPDTRKFLNTADRVRSRGVLPGSGEMASSQQQSPRSSSVLNLEDIENAADPGIKLFGKNKLDYELARGGSPDSDSDSGDDKHSRRREKKGKKHNLSGKGRGSKSGHSGKRHSSSSGMRSRDPSAEDGPDGARQECSPELKAEEEQGRSATSKVKGPRGPKEKGGKDKSGEKGRKRKNTTLRGDKGDGAGGNESSNYGSGGLVDEEGTVEYELVDDEHGNRVRRKIHDKKSRRGTGTGSRSGGRDQRSTLHSKDSSSHGRQFSDEEEYAIANADDITSTHRRRHHRQGDGNGEGDDQYELDEKGRRVRRKHRDRDSVGDGASSSGSAGRSRSGSGRHRKGTGKRSSSRSSAEGEEKRGGGGEVSYTASESSFDADGNASSDGDVRSLSGTDSLWSSERRPSDTDENDVALDRIDTGKRKERRRFDLWSKLCDILGREPPPHEVETSISPDDVSNSLSNKSNRSDGSSTSMRMSARAALIEQLQNLSVRDARKSIGFMGVYRDIEDYEDVIAIFNMLARRRERRLHQARAKGVFSILRHDTSIFFFDGEESAQKPVPTSPGEVAEVASHRADPGVYPTFWDADDKVRVLRRSPRPQGKKPVIPSRELQHVHPSAADLATHPDWREGSEYLNLPLRTKSAHLYSTALDADKLRSSHYTMRSKVGFRRSGSEETTIIYMVLPPPEKSVVVTGTDDVVRPIVMDDTSVPDHIPFLALTLQDGVGVVDAQVEQIPSTQLSDEAIRQSRGRSFLTPAQNQRIVELHRRAAEAREQRMYSSSLESSDTMAIQIPNAASPSQTLSPHEQLPNNLFQTFLTPVSHSHHAGGPHSTDPMNSSLSTPKASLMRGADQGNLPQPPSLPQISTPRRPYVGHSAAEDGSGRNYQAAETINTLFGSSCDSRQMSTPRCRPHRHRNADEDRDPLPLFSSLSTRQSSGVMSAGDIRARRQLKQVPYQRRCDVVPPPSAFDPARPAETTPFNASHRPLTYDVLPLMKL